jgi:cyanophycinase
VAIRLLIIVSVCLTGLARARGDDDNPLNLPDPLQVGSPGAVILHGGGALCAEIFDRFIELAGGRKARIVLIPSGTYVRGRRGIGGREFNESAAAFEERLRHRFGGWTDAKSDCRIAGFRLLWTDNQQDMHDPNFVSALRDATGVWIPAAYQGKLAWRFAPRYSEVDAESLFQRELRNVVARGGVVGGQGAGMAALPEVMILGDSGQQQGPAVADHSPGLALFNGAIVDQNFDVRGGRLERFTGLLKDTGRLNQVVTWPASGRNMIGLAVERETALVIQGNTIEALGEQRGHIFLKSHGDRTLRWRIVNPADGKVTLVAASASSETVPVSDRPLERNDNVRKNPFGIPAPLAPDRPGTIVLHGGGEMLDTIEFFPRLAGVPQPNFVHCPAASVTRRPRPGESKSQLTRRLTSDLHDWVKLVDDGRLAGIHFLTTSDAEDANDEEFVAPLRRADAVWFSGGDQSALADLFVDGQKPTLFQQALFDVVRRGGVVGGSSAGTAIMARVMTVSGAPIDDRPAEASIDRGFGILENVVLEQHFQGRGGRIERFTRLLLDNDRVREMVGDDGPKPENMIGLAIEEGAALLLRENRLRVFGQGNAHVFLKSADQKTITWHDLKPGDAAFIEPGSDGPVLELDGWRIR